MGHQRSLTFVLETLLQDLTDVIVVFVTIRLHPIAGVCDALGDDELCADIGVSRWNGLDVVQPVRVGHRRLST